jgi:hypothetical protein
MEMKAQNNVGIGTNAPDASAGLHIDFTDKGVLVPRLTDAQRTGVATPATGLLIYNSTSNEFQYFDGATWVSIRSSGSTPLLSGTGEDGRITFWSGTTTLSSSANLTWNNGANTLSASNISVTNNLSVTNATAAAGGIAIGSNGTQLTRVIKATNIGANVTLAGTTGATATADYTVNNVLAASAPTVMVSPADPATQTIFNSIAIAHAYVSADNTVTVRYMNMSGTVFTAQAVNLNITVVE